MTRLVSNEFEVVGVHIKDKESVTLTLRALPSSYKPLKTLLKLIGKVRKLRRAFYLLMKKEYDLCQEESTFDKASYGKWGIAAKSEAERKKPNSCHKGNSISHAKDCFVLLKS